MRKDPSAFQTYAELVNSNDFKEMVCEANLDPSSKAATKVMRQVLPVLAFGSRGNVMPNAAGDTTSLSHGMAMAKRYEPNTTLVTVIPDDINNPTSLWLALSSLNNQSYPAIADEDFFKKLQASEIVKKGNVQIPLVYSNCFKAAAHNPVAVAHEIQTMMENGVQML